MLVLYNEDNKNVKIDFKDNYIIVTDPPFNIGYKYNLYKDKIKEDDYYNNLVNIINNKSAVVIHYPENMYKLLFYLKRFPERVVSWVYNSNTARQHRDVAFIGVSPDFKKILQPYKNLNDKRIKERIKNGCKGSKLYDWWFVNQVKNVSKEKLDHPCQMPLEVMCNIIGVLPDDAVIVDPFMGTGTTGAAVLEMNKRQKVNRGFIGIEIDKKYYNIAKKRLEEENE